MHPIICQIGPLKIYSYGFMLALAFLTVTSFATLNSKKHGILPDHIFNFTFTCFLFGIIGARLFYAIENFAYYSKNPAEIFMLQYGGLSWFGGLILGSALGLVYLKIKKIPVYRMLDFIAPYLALGQAVGRLGCLLNGCCGGKTIIFPVQAYASALLFIIFLILLFLQKKAYKPGQIIFSYFFLYSIKRFFIEFWRTDNAIVFHGLTLFQFLSIGLFVFSLFKLVSLRANESERSNLSRLLRRKKRSSQ
ncbi:MAG: prolipoprotein diacylglyceryl transferase [Candidatus Omnitrophota bacterium]